MRHYNRTMFFIDGFNVYHAIDNARLKKYKWLNYWALSEKFLRGKDRVVGVLYFTAYSPWSEDKRTRHKRLISANVDTGVRVILGVFRKTTKKCGICNEQYQTYEEKRTDVNIAVHLFGNAQKDNYDKAVIVSGDSDLIPAITSITDVFPNKQFSLVIPIGRRARELQRIVGNESSMRMKDIHLETSQFPDKFTQRNGLVLERPIEWR